MSGSLCVYVGFLCRCRASLPGPPENVRLESVATPGERKGHKEIEREKDYQRSYVSTDYKRK